MHSCLPLDRVVHTGVTLAFRVMLNGMTNMGTIESSSSLGRPTSFLTQNRVSIRFAAHIMLFL